MPPCDVVSSCSMKPQLGTMKRDEAYPEESDKVLPVPGCRIQHVRCQSVVDNGHNIAMHLLASYQLNLTTCAKIWVDSL